MNDRPALFAQSNDELQTVTIAFGGDSIEVPWSEIDRAVMTIIKAADHVAEHRMPGMLFTLPVDTWKLDMHAPEGKPRTWVLQFRVAPYFGFNFALGQEDMVEFVAKTSALVAKQG